MQNPQSDNPANIATDLLIQCLEDPSMHGSDTLSRKFVEWPVVLRVPSICTLSIIVALAWYKAYDWHLIVQFAWTRLSEHKRLFVQSGCL